MTARPPSSFAALLRQDIAKAAMESEILAEKAASLGHHGRLVEKALIALREFDAGQGNPDERLALVKEAAHQVWAFFVQRELCGLRDQKEIIRFYGIPQEVLARLGAIDRR